MKIKIEDILPNPYRNIHKFPVDDDKLERIVKSIQVNGFWGGLRVRPSPEHDGKYELHFGWHRLTALKQLGYTELEVGVDVIIESLSKLQMCKRMDYENREFHHVRSVKAFNETVEAAKNLIEDHINEKNGVWEDLEKWCQDCFDGKHSFVTSYGMGASTQTNRGYSVGKGVLSKFLGPDYPPKKVTMALNCIREESFSIEDRSTLPPVMDRETLESLENFGQVDAVRGTLSTNRAREVVQTKEDQRQIVSETQKDMEEEGVKPSASEYEKRINKKIEERHKNETPNKSQEDITEVVTYSHSIIKNLNYYTKMIKNFEDHTLHPEDIPNFPLHVAEMSYRKLAQAINHFVKVLQEYESLYGFKSNVPKSVYDFYDSVSEEEYKLRKTLLDEMTEGEPELDVDEWLNEMDSEEYLVERIKKLQSTKYYDIFQMIKDRSYMDVNDDGEVYIE